MYFGNQNRNIPRLLQSIIRFIAVVFWLLLPGMLLQIHAQTFHYFEYKITVNNQELPCIGMLTVFPDGTTTSRIQYIHPGTNDAQRIEVCYTGTPLHPRYDTLQTADSMRMIPGEPCLRNGNNRLPLYVPVFDFVSHTDSLGTYYLPAAVSYATQRGMQPAHDVHIKNFDFASLDKALLGYFYNPAEPFYQTYTQSQTRALPAAQKNAVLHLIVVANTLDDTIGASCRLDMFRVSETFDRLCSLMGIKMRPVYLYDKRFSKREVDNALRQLRPKPEDIVVFYYSGHGFRTAATKSQFPEIDLTTSLNQPLQGNTLPMQQIYQTILAKRARVSLVFSDCCNAKPGAGIPQAGQRLITRSLTSPLSIPNCQALFFPPRRLSVLATAADVDQLAASNKTYGGIYSWNLLAALTTFTSTARSNVSWIQLLTEARRNTAQQAINTQCGPARCFQQPWFSVKR